MNFVLVGFGKDFVFVLAGARRCAVESCRIVEITLRYAGQEDFKVSAAVAVVGSRSVTLLTCIVAGLASFRQRIGVLIFTAFVLALLAASILFTFGADTLVETVAGAFFASRMAESTNCLLRSWIFLVETVGTWRVLNQTFLDRSIQDHVIAIDATVIGESISWAAAAVAGFMAFQADAIFDVFIRRTFIHAMFAIFDVLAVVAVVRIWALTRSSALGMAIAAGFAVDLIDAEERNLINFHDNWTMSLSTYFSKDLQLVRHVPL